MPCFFFKLQANKSDIETFKIKMIQHALVQDNKNCKMSLFNGWSDKKKKHFANWINQF